MLKGKTQNSVISDQLKTQLITGGEMHLITWPPELEVQHVALCGYGERGIMCRTIITSDE